MEIVMPKDNFGSSSDSLIAPANDAFEITPDDVQDLEAVTKAIYIGTGGDVVVRLLEGSSDITFANLQDGSILDVRLVALRATGTTASDIVGLV